MNTQVLLKREMNLLETSVSILCLNSINTRAQKLSLVLNSVINDLNYLKVTIISSLMLCMIFLKELLVT